MTRKRILYSAGVLLLTFLVGLVVWQASFREGFDDFAPSSPQQIYTLWAVSTLIFLLTVTLGFMLVRNFVKLYVERRSNREGSRIRTKLVLGALTLTFLPVVFLVIFSVGVMNRNIDKWFSRPAENIKLNLQDVGKAIDAEAAAKAQAQADWLSSLPDVQFATHDTNLQRICDEKGILVLRVDQPERSPAFLCKAPGGTREPVVRAEAGLPNGGKVVVQSGLPIDMAHTQHEIRNAIAKYDQLAQDKRSIRRVYVLLLLLITLFVLFVATWLALFFAKQISVPISALLGAANQVRGGDLTSRVRVQAVDEIAMLVRAFNEMTQELEANSRELENRRRFTEAILESIPTGVISLASNGAILRVNRALKGIFPAAQVDRAARLEQLFSREDTAEIRYLMNRARRMGLAASQFELKTEQRVLHLSVTVAALDDKTSSGFVIVLEDTSDLLRAQRAAAWHEVARRIAHEIKNPLTPIALCAERIIRQLDRKMPDANRIIRDCSATIVSEVQCVKQLVDEFSQFARFPAAQPVASDLNEVVENALGVFAGRLDGIDLRKDLASNLPQVNIDREQFKRLIVNLIDNAAEAMKDALVKRLYVSTSAPSPDTVELAVADTGCGISQDDKEKLFLPYFSTKGRGTGLGLAIVNHIVSEHNAQIRVENNVPLGARFTVELVTLSAAQPDLQHAETQA